MPIGFIKKWGAGKTVPEYIVLIGLEHNCPLKVAEKAKSMYFHLAKISTYIEPTPRMMAAVLIFLAAKDEHHYIYSGDWKEKEIAAYNQLIEHAKKVKPLLEEEFPGLKKIKIGNE